MTYEVVTLGSATLDIFADTFDRKHLTKEQKSMRYNHIISYHTGAKILIKELNLTVGGGGTNTALTFSRFGLKTAYCGALGKDSTGAMIRAFLEDNKIGFIGQIINKKTNLSVILDSIEHDRTILAYKGSSDFLDYKKIPELKDVKLFYSSSMMGESEKTFIKLAKFAQKNNIKVAYNPSEYQAVLGYKKLKSILENTNFLILNKEEAQDLAMNTTPKEKDLLKLLKKHTADKSVIVITDAHNGAFAYDGNNIYHATPKQVKAIETTGAGDAFASAFMAGLLKEESIEESLKLGLANAESVISHKGAKEIILTYEEAKKLVKKRKFRVEILN